MSKKFTYIEPSTGRVLFETIEPNYVALEDVNKKMRLATYVDPARTGN